MSIPVAIIQQARYEAASRMAMMLMYRNERDNCLEPKYQRLSQKEMREMIDVVVQGGKK